MLIRSGKMQFLFWAAFFSVMLYLWIIAVGLQTFVLPDEKPLEIPYDVVLLMFILYGLLAVTAVAGTLVAILIDNRFYRNFFGALMIISLASVIGAKSLFG